MLDGVTGAIRRFLRGAGWLRSHLYNGNMQIEATGERAAKLCPSEHYLAILRHSRGADQLLVQRRGMAARVPRFVCFSQNR
jgi:hypothetical protein